MAGGRNVDDRVGDLVDEIGEVGRLRLGGGGGSRRHGERGGEENRGDRERARRTDHAGAIDIIATHRTTWSFSSRSIANAGAGRCRRRAGPRKGAGGAVARHGCPTLHRAQASQSARPCARAPTRGNLERLPRHDLRRDARRGRDPAQGVRPQMAPQMPSRRRKAWRKPATSCSPSRASRRANGSRLEPRTRASDCTKNSSAGSRPRPYCPAPKPPPCCSGRCSPQDRSPCARSTDGRPSPRSQTIASLTSPRDRIASCRPKARQKIPTQLATGPSLLRCQSHPQPGCRCSSRSARRS